MYIVHIKITLHIQVPVYCKNVPAHLIMSLPPSVYTAKTIDDATESIMYF